jgi:hypothetical protein
LWTGNNEFTPSTQNITMRKLSLPNLLTYTESSALTNTEITGKLTLNNVTIKAFPTLDSTITNSTPASNQLIPKSYADGLITTLKSGANTFTGLNTFKNIVVNDPNNNQCISFDGSNNLLISRPTTLSSNTLINNLTLPTLPTVSVDRTSVAQDLNLIQKITAQSMIDKKLTYSDASGNILSSITMDTSGNINLKKGNRNFILDSSGLKYTDIDVSGNTLTLFSINSNGTTNIQSLTNPMFGIGSGITFNDIPKLDSTYVPDPGNITLSNQLTTEGIC